MDRKHEAFSITCHNFSDIRRRPLVIGKLDQVRLPFVVTMPQLAVGAMTFALLFVTRPVWGAIMSDRLHIVTFVVLPILVAQQVSRTSIEGRTVSKAALGFLRLWLASPDGEINGRRRRRPTGTDAVVVHPLVPTPTGSSMTPTPAAASTAAPVSIPRRRRTRGRAPVDGPIAVSRRTMARRARLGSIQGMQA